MRTLLLPAALISVAGCQARGLWHKPEGWDLRSVLDTTANATAFTAFQVILF